MNYDTWQVIEIIIFVFSIGNALRDCERGNTSGVIFYLALATLALLEFRGIL